MNKESIAAEFQLLQDRICKALEKIDGKRKEFRDIRQQPGGIDPLT